MNEKEKPLTIHTFISAFKLRKELYHWDRFVLPRPIPVATVMFLFIWTLVQIALLISGILPLLSDGGTLMVFDFIGRFLVIPAFLAYIVNNVPAQGRSILRFFLAKMLRLFRPRATRLGSPVEHRTIRNSQLTQIVTKKEE